MIKIECLFAALAAITFASPSFAEDAPAPKFETARQTTAPNAEIKHDDGRGETRSGAEQRRRHRDLKNIVSLDIVMHKQRRHRHHH